MASAAQWTTFLTRSLAARLEPDTFSSYAQLLSAKNPLSPLRIADIFLRTTEYNDVSLDPRVPRYLQVLLGAELVDAAGILKALARYSTFLREAASSVPSQDVVEIEGEHKMEGVEAAEGGGLDNQKPEPKKGGKAERVVRRWSNSYAAEEMLFYRLAKHISSGAGPRNVQEAVQLVLVCRQWMEMVSVTDDILGLGVHGHSEEINAAIMALGTLMVAVVENERVVAALAGKCPKGTAKELSTSLESFIRLLVQSAPQSAARLELFRTQTLISIEPVDKKEQEANKKLEEMLDETIGLGIDSIVVGDLPTVNSRAGLYVYLNSMLVGRPLIDDNAIFAYLHNRYQSDIQSTTIDLILASFDILANATFRNEGSQTTTILRSFLINKLPLLLSTLSASLFPPLNSEFCITQALSHVDTNAFPTLSSLFDESSNSNMFSDSVRQDFCFACCLHGLVEESSIEALLGDIPMQSLPTSGVYVKDDLVQQCLSDPERAEGLIDELEHMDGNVGAVSQAITEVIGRLCTNKETMSLKTLCTQLARKPSSLDIMLLFDKPSSILHPICELLDNWHYEEDQGEYQPVYEEFGSILLLVLAFVYRYNLSTIDLGIRTSDSFIAKLLNQGHLSRAMENLTEQEQSHLDGWIRGLFDNESGGLTDELMGSCPPQDFYLLVPTLFHHIVLACSTNNLSDEGLKGGLEYLVDTFLLPSLVGAITWLSAHLWESRGDSANAVLQILSVLILSPISSNEASIMLNSILNIIARPLEHSLRWLQKAEPSRQDVEPLLKKLKNHLRWERRGGSEHTELEAWTGTPGGGLTVSVKQTIVSLVHWGLNPGINVMPATYTHRQILTALKMLGAKRLLNTIIEEVKTQTESGNGSIVIDVATALICAPDSASWGSSLRGLGGLAMLDEETELQPLQRRMNLREALKFEVDKAPKIHTTDAIYAETLVRLFRCVEAQLALPQQIMAHDGMNELGIDAGLQGALDGALADSGLQGALDSAGAAAAQQQSIIDDAIASAAAAADQDLMDLIGGHSGGDLFGTGLDGDSSGMGF